MSGIIEFARRCYGFVDRRLHPPHGPFPVDAWSDIAGLRASIAAHRATAAELARQRAEQGAFAYRPRFSLIVPLYRTPLGYLRTMADSVLAQTYGNLELVLVNASPELPELARAVEAYRAADDRVTVVALEGNLGITENTNRGLDAASGDFCCFLDHDDAIEPDLLYEYVRALNEQPDIDVLYCDEDLVSADAETGELVPERVLYKPAYAPELLLCKNYIVHLMTIRRTLIDEMPRPDARFDGTQDYNMVLFCTSRARRVHNVPKVLYHWRISETSTAANPDAKPYSQRSYRLAAAGELSRRVPGGHIVPSGIVNVHDIWMDGTASPSVSVIMDARGGGFDLVRALEALAQTNSHPRAEIVAVGTEGELAGLAWEGGIAFRPVPCAAGSGRFARLNLGARAAAGDCLVFLDPGCFFATPAPLEQLSALCALDGVGAAAPRTLYRNGCVKSYGVAVTAERIMPLFRGFDDDFPAYQCNMRAMQNASALGLQGLSVRRSAFEGVGGFDEGYEGEIGAADLCRRVRGLGLRLVATPTVKLQVEEGYQDMRYDNATNAPDYTASDLARYDASWPGERAAGDPYLNPNLDQGSSYYQIAQVNANR